MHTALFAAVAWAMFALAIPSSLDLFSDSLVTRDGKLHVSRRLSRRKKTKKKKKEEKGKKEEKRKKKEEKKRKYKLIENSSRF